MVGRRREEAGREGKNVFYRKAQEESTSFLPVPQEENTPTH